MPGWFKPLRGKVHIQNILAFDIEGTGEAGGFVCGAIAGDSVLRLLENKFELSDFILLLLFV